MVKDNGTPWTRLKAAVESLNRAEVQFAEKSAALAVVKKQLEDRENQEAYAASVLEAARAAVRKAAKDMAE